MKRREFAAATAGALLVSCRQDLTKTFGVIPKGASHIFWKSIHAGAIKAGRETGYKVDWNAPHLEIDAGRQIMIVEAMLNRRLAGIAMAPVDKRALIGVVERAAREGIPMVIFDSGVDTQKRLCYIATNNLEGGRMAARRLGQILGGKGKVGNISFMPGSASTMEREAGFTEAMQRDFPGVTLLPTQFGMADRAKAMAVTENLMTAHSDLAGLFADNESSATGAVQAMKSRNAKHIKLVAFDPSPQIAEDIRTGWIDSLVAQNPFRMGYESVQALARHIAGDRVEPYIDSGARLILREDLDKPDIRELLFPDLKPYLGADA